MLEFDTVLLQFTSDWMKKWREYFSSQSSLVKQSQLLFDNQLKAALIRQF